MTPRTGGLLRAGTLLSLAVLACSSGRRADTPKHLGPPVNALVAWGGDGVAVKNLDSTHALQSVQLKLNMTQFGGNSGVASAGTIAPGKAVTVPFFDFVDSDLHRFNIRTTAIMSVYLKASIGGVPTSKLYLCPNQRCVEASDQ